MAAQGCGVARRHSAGAVVLVFIVGQQPRARGRALDAGSNELTNRNKQNLGLLRVINKTLGLTAPKSSKELG